MVYKGTSAIESIFFHTAGNSEEVHWINLTTTPDTNTFMVTCSCCDDWKIEFEYSKSDYERIKYAIMEAMFENDKLSNLFRELAETLEDGFDDILIK